MGRHHRHHQQSRHRCHNLSHQYQFRLLRGYSNHLHRCQHPHRHDNHLHPNQRNENQSCQGGIHHQHPLFHHYHHPNPLHCCIHRYRGQVLIAKMDKGQLHRSIHQNLNRVVLLNNPRNQRLNQKRYLGIYR